jgi:carboxyl-terminal processing protease
MVLQNKWLPIFTGVCVIFILGFVSAGFVDATNKKSYNFTKFWEATQIMDKKFTFREKVPTPSKQIDGAIRGMVASYGDPYTVYLSKDQLKSLKDDVAGEFAGIGVEVGMKNNFLTVIAPIKGSPAEKAGFKSGDIFYKIDNKDVTDLPAEEIIQKIRGEKGSTVVMEMVRPSEPKPVILTVVRDTIDIPDTKLEMIDGVPVVSLYTFTRDSVQQIHDALVAVAKQNPAGMVIDLRNNPGGYLDSAVEIASMILPKNASIVVEKPGENKAKQTVFRSSGYGTLPSTIKIVVLLNEGSASASEILAGALRDNNRATVIGSKSFGKGSVQEVIDMKDGSGIKVTIAKWYTPNGVSLSEKGITPDIESIDASHTDKSDDVMNRAFEFLKLGK